MHPGALTTTLITGADKGLGFEAARRLLAEGHDVWVAARDPRTGATAAEELGARFVQLDVTDDASVAAAVATVGHVYGPVRVLQAFLPLLLASDNGVVVNVASGLGSQSATHDPDRVESSVVAPAYCSSKSALVMLTTQYAKSLTGLRVNAVDPGCTATDLKGHSGTQTVTERTDAIVATVGPDGPTGTFTDRDGTVAW